MSLLKLLGLDLSPSEAKPDSPETATVRKIIEALDSIDPSQARYIASFAYVLSRVAHADRNISKEELRAMEEIVVEYGKLPREQAVIVVQMAKTQSLLFGGTENYLVTREFNKIATREQKEALLHCLFAVSSSDESISTTEEAEIRQIADELKLDHQDYIAARLRFREHLAVLKKPSPRKR